MLSQMANIETEIQVISTTNEILVNSILQLYINNCLCIIAIKY